MRLRIAMAMSLLLIPSLSWGGAASKLRGVMTSCSASTGTANSINGVTEFLDGGDTGTATMSSRPLCSGTASILATCDGTTGDSAAVYLVINGVTTTALSCAIGEPQKSQTLTATVTGIYTARVYGDGAGYSAAGSFSFPIAQ